MGPGEAHITELRTGQGSLRRRVTVYLDSEPWRTTTTSVVRKLGVAVGDTCDPRVLDEMARELETPELRERAVRLLGYRERSEADLRTRLLDDGYPTDLVDALVTEFADLGLVDDERFAGMLARSLIQLRGLGRDRARRELSRHGLTDEIVDAALDTVAPSPGEADRALEVAKRSLRSSDNPDRLAARLARRGFSPSIAFRVARTVVADGWTDTQNSS